MAVIRIHSSSSSAAMLRRTSRHPHSAAGDSLYGIAFSICVAVTAVLLLKKGVQSC